MVECRLEQIGHRDRGGAHQEARRERRRKLSELPVHMGLVGIPCVESQLREGPHPSSGPRERPLKAKDASKGLGAVPDVGLEEPQEMPGGKPVG